MLKKLNTKIITTEKDYLRLENFNMLYRYCSKLIIQNKPELIKFLESGSNKILKYFIEFIVVDSLFLIFKILGYRLSSNFGSFIGKIFGPLLRSREIISKNLKIVFPRIDNDNINKISKNMWSNYGRIFSDYMYLKDFRSSKLNKYLTLNGKNILEKIKNDKNPVIFISGHFNNFELMAMQIEKSGIDLPVKVAN